MGILTVVTYAIYVSAAVLMVFAILLQEGKGGGLSALGGTQAESAFGATNPIRRMTVVLAILFFVIAGFLSYIGSRKRSMFPDEKKPPATAVPEEGAGETSAEEGHDHDREDDRSVEEERPAERTPEAGSGEKAPGAAPRGESASAGPRAQE